MPFKKIDDNKWEPKYPCTDPEHNPPGMIVLEPGTYEYTCPSCGEKRTIIVGPKPTLKRVVGRKLVEEPVGKRIVDRLTKFTCELEDSP